MSRAGAGASTTRAGVARRRVASRARRGDRGRRDATARSNEDPRTATRVDVVVAGNGPIGAACARHVSERRPELRVAVLDSERLRSGSDDLGRIARPLDAEGRDEWTALNARSIDGFEEAERLSGIQFFTRKGSLAIGSEAFVERGAARLRARGVTHERRTNADGGVAEALGFLARDGIPSEYEAVWDEVGGYVNPHAMRAAQNALMRRASEGRATVTRTTCERVESNAATGECEVRTSTGETYACDVCVLACGFYTEPLARECGLLTDDASADFGDVKIARRTVLLAEVLESEALGALATMPTIKYEVPRAVLDAARVRASSGGGSDHSVNEAKSVYVLPPIYYPGPEPAPGWYIKIGGGPLDYFDKSDPSWARTERELADWMSSDGDEVVADQLQEILFHLFPSTNFQSLTSKACAYSTSDDGSLKIQTLGPGANIIAVGACQGKGAGPADAIGADVAERALRALDARRAP